MINTQDQLRQVFNDNFVAYFRSHVAHVNITGRTFESDHRLLRKIYEARQAEIDVIAEMIRTTGDFVPTTLATVMVDSVIDDDAVAGTSEDILEMIRGDLTVLTDQFVELNRAAAEEGADEIANYAQEQILALRKHLWMLDATLTTEQ
jgi:DNA-binding ferritin-like protein